MSSEKPKEPEDGRDKSIREIVRGIYQIRVPLSEDQTVPLPYVNVYLVEGTHGWFLIDTGWSSPGSLEFMNTTLGSLGLSLKDISTIIITHCHPDHFGLAGKIKHLSPRIQILMHRWELNLMESRYIRFSEPQEKMSILLISHGVPVNLIGDLEMAFMPALELVTITDPDHILYSGEIIDTGIYQLEAIWTPGHSPGHICLYEHGNGFLFSGDHILPNITPNISYHILSGDNPLGDYLYALGKLSNLPVTQVHPGHQYSFSDLKGRVKAILNHHQARENEIQKFVGNGTYSAYEIAANISWEIPGLSFDEFVPFHKRMAITETIAHVEHMRWEGKLRKTLKDKYILYSKA
ncbi:MAG: MBL fold metallo-hydrolase [Dehalococcoidales bacterium]|nr:MBL fold metallo-hydrolase [Dehalococcoidales bacterium]